ncbi:MAG: autotransporter-associated beta strand repeat-containing protein, partial [Chlamydiae bacterium]|nr:autotransporter-associated beta strand repeat-containing protein [Chlamydiota bacterium]
NGLGTVAITKTGTGTLILSGANTYSGTTTLTAGTLKGGAANVFGGSVSASALVMNGGTLDMGGFDQGFGSLTGSNNITSSSAGSITATFGFDNTSPAAYSGIIQNGSGTVGITKTGTGTLILSGANTYTGTTTVTAGILKGGAANVFGGSVSASALVMGGGTLDMGGFNQAFGSLTGSGTITSGSAGSITATFGFDNTSPAAYSGIIQNGSGAVAITKTGTGTLILSGANTYTGTTTITAGTLKGGAANAFGGSVSASALVISGTLDMGGFDQAFGSLTGSGTITSSSAGALTATFGLDNTSPAAYSGLIQDGLGTVGVTKTGAGLLQFSGASPNTYTGTTTVSAGTLQLNKTVGPAVPSTVVNINGGTLQLAAADQISNSAAVTISPGTFDLGGNTETISSLTFQAGTLSQGGATLSLSSTATALTMRDTTISGNITLSGGIGGDIVFDNTNNGTATISGTLNLGSASRTFNISSGTADNDMNITGNITNGLNTITITKTGAGTLRLGGTVDEVGSTQVNAGILRVEGTLNTKHIDVNPSGTVSGAGTIVTGSTTFINHGIVRPGDPLVPNEIAILTIDGNYENASDGTLYLDAIDTTIPTDYYTRLRVINGSVKLNGTLIVNFYNTVDFSDVDTFMLIDNTSGTGLSGTFATVEYIDLPANVGVFLEYQANALLLIYGVTLQSYIDISRMFFSTIEEENKYLLSRLYNIEQSQRYYKKHRTYKQKNYLTANDNGQILCENKDKPHSNSLNEERSIRTKPWEIYIGGLSSSQNMKDVPFSSPSSVATLEPGFDASSLGLIGGIEHNFSTGMVGFAAVIEELKENVNNNWGKVNEFSMRANIYSSIYCPKIQDLTFKLIVGGGREEYRVHRTIALRHLTANGNPTAKEVNGLFGIDYAIRIKDGSITPLANLQYAYLSIDKITETGSDVINNYIILQQKRQSFQSNLGIRADYSIVKKRFIFEPELHFYWQRNLLDNARNVRMEVSFQENLVTQQVLGRGKQIMYLGAGLAVRLNNNVSIKAYYDHAWNKDLHSNFFYLTLGRDF